MGRAGYDRRSRYDRQTVWIFPTSCVFGGFAANWRQSRFLSG